MSLDAWLASLQATLPPGRALPRAPGARLTKLLTALAAQFKAAQDRLEAVLVQWDPRVATTLLTDWEQLLGLPDECQADLTLTVGDRQRIAFARLTEQGGQSVAYFKALLAAYGEPDAVIDHKFRPATCNDTCNDELFSEADRFVWRVRIQHPPENVRAMTCNDNCNDALQLYQPALAECPLQERKPAHTVLVFAYQPASDALLDALHTFVHEDMVDALGW